MSTVPQSPSSRPPAHPAVGLTARFDADPGVEIPLVDWGSLALRAGRVGPVLPHMAWLLRFPDPVTEATLTRRLGAWRRRPTGSAADSSRRGCSADAIVGARSPLPRP